MNDQLRRNRAGVDGTAAEPVVIGRAEIDRAVAILRGGGLVAFPTETVYGLGADARQAHAVAKIFAVKGRPPTNPLICHAADIAVARRYAAQWPDHATALAERFWPGPLTLVVRSDPSIVSAVRAGRETVGLRVPDHPLALELLRAFDGPLAGPSANRSNHISPTTADHVRADLGDRIEFVLDGGPCIVGIESTVLDLTGATPTILRPGQISRMQIEAVIRCAVVEIPATIDSRIAAVSPGQQAVHYAPRTPAVRCVNCAEKSGRVILRWPWDDAERCARFFYAELRRLDELDADEIAIEFPPDEPRWAALRDRIRRATSRDVD